jgi:hypothetical protein
MKYLRRWDHSHLHAFEFGDDKRYMLGGSELEPGDRQQGELVPQDDRRAGVRAPRANRGTAVDEAAEAPRARPRLMPAAETTIQ